jgi:hypothetical protein
VRAWRGADPSERAQLYVALQDRSGQEPMAVGAPRVQGGVGCVRAADASLVPEGFRKAPAGSTSHNLQPASFPLPTSCSLCSLLMWGIVSQGFQCVGCRIVAHHDCVRDLEPKCEAQCPAVDALCAPARLFTLPSLLTEGACLASAWRRLASSARARRRRCPRLR